jgi:hypothetical protein
MGTLAVAVAILLALPLSRLGAGGLGGAVAGLLNGATHVVQQSVQRVTVPTRPGTTVHPAGPASPVSVAPTSSPASAGLTPYATPHAGDPTIPAMYGTNPHGQGSVVGASLPPNTVVPYTYNPAGSTGEILVVGRGRSEQNADGTYHAHTTILGLLGAEVLGVDAAQGQSKTGPLDPVNQILKNLCNGTNQAVCANVLAADTAATTSGAMTHFSVLQLGALGTTVGAQAATSDSSINTAGSCQSSSGASHAANVTLASGQLASVANSKEGSNACTGQTPSQTTSSSVIQLAGTGVPIPAPGCANGTANTLSGLPVLLPIICNADSTSQLQAPSGVREALTVLGIQMGSTAVLKSVVAAAESYAVAPAAATTPKCSDTDKDCGIGPGGGPEICVNGQDPDNDGDCTASSNGGTGASKCKDTDKDCKNGNTGAPGSCSPDQQDNDGDCDGSGSVSAGNANGNGNGNGAEGNEGAGTGATGASAGGLPFTGQNLLEVVLLGLLLTGGGLLLYTKVREQKR